MLSDTDEDTEIRVGVATSLEHLADTFRIRACNFVAEQDCPMEEEFDGNDYCGTHILAWKNDKAIATTRLRYFNNFVKVERISILKQHRSARVFLPLVNFIRNYTAAKGFDTLYTQADARMQTIYARFGFEVLGNGEVIEHFGSTYVGMISQTEKNPTLKPIEIHSHHEILNAIEGYWPYHV